MRSNFKLILFITVSILCYHEALGQVSLLKDIHIGSGSSFLEKPTIFNGKLYFQASGATFAETGIYESDGTPTGTLLLESSIFTDELTATSDFLAWSGPPISGTGTRIWRRINGVVESTGNANNYAQRLFPYNGEMFYSGHTSSEGFELWKLKSTGSPEIVKSLPQSGSPSSLTPSRFINHSDGSFFFLSWRINSTCSLWRSSGDEASTYKVIDSPYTSEIFSVGSFIYFFRKDTEPFYSGPKQLWVSDGTAVGTYEIKDFGSGYPGTTQYAGHHDKFYFFAPEPDDTYELWQSDGTSAGTMAVSNIDIDSGFPTFLGSVGNNLFFKASKSGSGPVLYRYDDNLDSIILVKDINTASTTSGNMNPGVNFLNKLYFSADDGINDLELWSSDGTSSGTQMVEDINSDGNSEVSYLTVLGNRLFFLAADPVYGYEPRIFIDPLNPPCMDSLNLIDSSIQDVYEASVIIESVQLIPLGASTVYHSPAIHLNPGFIANTSTIFKAEPVGCN